jgi:3-isopropylmalate dehydratase small subunit
MDSVTSVQGPAIPLPVPDIDTDVITPVKRVMEGTEAITKYAFEPLRFTPDGALDPDCLLNQDAYRNAPILLAGANFACGSSRETAVWAIRGLGVRCIIAPSFAVNPVQRETLLGGRDSIELTLGREDEIAGFQDRDRELRPWVYELAHV